MNTDILFVYRFFPILVVSSTTFPFIYVYHMLKANIRSQEALVALILIMIFCLSPLVYFSMAILKTIKLKKIGWAFFISTLVLHALDLLTTFFDGRSGRFSLDHARLIESNRVVAMLLAMDASTSLILSALFLLTFLSLFVLFSLYVFTLKHINSDNPIVMMKRFSGLKNVRGALFSYLKSFIISLYYYYLFFIKKKRDASNIDYLQSPHDSFPLSFRILLFYIFNPLYMLVAIINNILIILESTELYYNKDAYLILDGMFETNKYLQILLIVSLPWSPGLFLKLRKFVKNIRRNKPESMTT